MNKNNDGVYQLVKTMEAHTNEHKPNEHKHN